MLAPCLSQKIERCEFLDIHTHCDGYPIKEHNRFISILEKKRILCFSSGSTLSSWEANRELSEKSPWIVSCTGIHPWQCGTFEPEDLSELEEQFSGTVMISEIGLDRLWAPEDSPHAKQLGVFKQQLALAEKYDKPVTIHTKGAEQDVLDILRSHKGSVLIHWYDGPKDLISEFLDLGCYFTIPPAVIETHRGEDSYGRTLLTIPAERLLPETDNPSAWPWLFQKQGRPEQIREIYNSYARLVGKNKTFVHTVFQENLFRFLRL